MGGLRPAVLALVLAAAAPPAPAADPTLPSASETARELLGGSSYQRELPLRVEVAPAADAEGGRGAGGPPRQIPAPPPPPAASGGMAVVLAALFWALAAVVAALLGISLLRSLREAGRASPPAPAPALPPAVVEAPAALPPSSSLREADGLAAGGRFPEAAHALLLLAITDVRSFRGEPLPPNLTSREIASRPGIPREAAAALDALVRAVEVVLFGGHPADRPLFDACRERYLALHGALARRAA